MGEVKANNEAFWDLSYGLYIVTSRDGERMNGQIATAAMQVTAVPPKIVVCLSKETLTHELLIKSGKFGITVLDQEITMQEIGPWGFRSGRDIDKFRNAHYRIGVETGVPLVLDHALSVLEAKRSTRRGNSHHVSGRQRRRGSGETAHPRLLPEGEEGQPRTPPPTTAGLRGPSF